MSIQFAFCLGLSLIWSSALKAQTPNAGPKAHNPKLNAAAEELASLLYYGPGFENPSSDQRQRIMQSLKALEKLSHAAKVESAIHSAVDPVMRYVSLDLPLQFQNLQNLYGKGDLAQARFALKQTIHYCVSCHSINSPRNPGVFAFPPPLKGMSETEKGDFYTAVRRYPEAMLAYEKVLTQKSIMSQQPQLWNHALENLLAITIRYRNDAHITLEMISRLQENGGLSAGQSELLKAWRVAAKAWTREKLKPQLKGAALMAKAQQLVEQGDSLGKRGRAFAYPEYLRAMNIVHELALKGETEMLKAAGFRLAGEVSEKLKLLNVWMYPEVYYEACIRSHPHGAESRRCWTNFDSYRRRETLTLWDADHARILKGLAQ